eukprot:4125522-Lingulodinium_polyedra.AAC.1
MLGGFAAGVMCDDFVGALVRPAAGSQQWLRDGGPGPDASAFEGASAFYEEARLQDHPAKRVRRAL